MRRAAQRLGGHGVLDHDSQDLLPLTNQPAFRTWFPSSWSVVIGHWSLVIVIGQVIGHWSLVIVIGHFPQRLESSLAKPPLRGPSPNTPPRRSFPTRPRPLCRWRRPRPCARTLATSPAETGSRTCSAAQANSRRSHSCSKLSRRVAVGSRQVLQIKLRALDATRLAVRESRASLFRTT